MIQKCKILKATIGMYIKLCNSIKGNNFDDYNMV